MKDPLFYLLLTASFAKFTRSISFITRIPPGANSAPIDPECLINGDIISTIWPCLTQNAAERCVDQISTISQIITITLKERYEIIYESAGHYRSNGITY